MAITRLRVSNFRCIRELDLALPEFAALIGPNGAGKSTLLASLRAFWNVAAQQLTPMISHYGGFGTVMRRNGSNSGVCLQASVQLEKALLDYRIDLLPEDPGYFISREEARFTPDTSSGMAQQGEVLVIPEDYPLDNPKVARMGPGFLLASNGHDRWYPAANGPVVDRRGKVSEPCLPTISSQHPLCASIVQSFSKISYWDTSRFQLDDVRRPQLLEPAGIPSTSGHNLFSVLYGIKTERRDDFEDLIDTLRVAFPELKGIEFPIAGGGHVTLNWFQEGSSKPMNPRQLSDGTLRLLWLVTVLHTAPDDGLVLIDEPEISLHPQWLQFLAGFLQSTSARTQIIVATQSDQFIRWLEPSELLIADMEAGGSRFRWGSEFDLKAWLDEYTLDRLWLMGVLGGRR